VVVFGTSFRLMDGTDAERDALLAYVPWAEALGGAYLRVFDGGEDLNEPMLARGAAVLRWWNELRRRHEWKSELVIETHDSLLTAAAVRRFLDAMPRDTRILWDAHHTWRKGGEDVVTTWAAIARAVAHMHVKDSVAVPSGRLPYTYVLPGAGDFPMARLREALTRGEYAGALSLEWERRWHPQLPPLEDALAAADRGWW
ncbi:MAG TPA: TIM barrel protein, partial [Candidatus Synoicihabitans sp.]|nr:TIM barrel protein [Candidatus Synoicihabitans sp.]